MSDSSFIDVIADALSADPTNLALREDFIVLLLDTDPDRAAREIESFEAAGGNPAKVRLLRARLLAARLRSPGVPGAGAPPQATAPAVPPAPAAPPAPAPDRASPVDAGQSDATDGSPAPDTPDDGEADAGAETSSSGGHPAARPVPAATDADLDEDDDPDSDAGEGLWDWARPTITLSDVKGLQDVKAHLDSTFLAPLRNPELAAAFGQTARGSLLMYGPPGCGKTFIARAIAGDLGANFLSVTLADLLSKWIGDTERAIASLFRHARAAAPCVIFIDEFDALGGRRSSGGGGTHSLRMMVTQLLEELDGVASDNEGVYFLAATNRPWDVDPALRRPGRIDRTVLVLPPDAEARAAIIAGTLKDKPTEDVAPEAVAAVTDGFSGADISHLAASALQQAMSASMASGTLVPVTQEMLLRVAQGITPSTRVWFDQVAPVLEYGVDDGTFDQLRAYRVERGMR